MGKSIEFARPDDKVCLGLTSKLENGNHLLFLDFDSKRLDSFYFDKIRKYLSIEFQKNISLLAYQTAKGYHAIALNQFSEIESYKMMLYLLGKVDRWHIGYSIAKGFATLRISKKSVVDDMKFVYFNRGLLPISKPHFYLFKYHFEELGIYEKSITSWFDEGIHFVGYIMDKDKI